MQPISFAALLTSADLNAACVLEEHRTSSPHWKSRRRMGRPTVLAYVPCADSHDGAGQPALGARRIHDELLELGIDVCQATVAKYLVRRRQPPSRGPRKNCAGRFLETRRLDT
jgi:hypothetical protein